MSRLSATSSLWRRRFTGFAKFNARQIWSDEKAKKLVGKSEKSPSLLVASTCARKEDTSLDGKCNVRGQFEVSWHWHCWYRFPTFCEVFTDPNLRNIVKNTSKNPPRDRTEKVLKRKKQKHKLFSWKKLKTERSEIPHISMGCQCRMGKMYKEKK